MLRRLIPIAIAALGLALAVPGAAQATKPKPRYYVSLGDSYAAGYQPVPRPKGSTNRHGFAYQLVGKARKRGYDFKLVNFGCSGETTTSILQRTSKCAGLGPGGVHYAGKTQVAAAVRFLKRHKGQIGLITVSIGGNDLTACAKQADPVACVGPALDKVKANAKVLLTRLRKAAGTKTRIVGITYPDVLLGAWVSGVKADQDLASLSVTAFKALLNPALKEIYRSVGAKFVDVTAASGSYTPLEQTTTLAPYGQIPVAVAKICALTYYCQYKDIHPKTSGYALIAKLVAETLPRKHH
jgi:lysophospholipase L1-like esterase